MEYIIPTAYSVVAYQASKDPQDWVLDYKESFKRNRLTDKQFIAACEGSRTLIAQMGSSATFKENIKERRIHLKVRGPRDVVLTPIAMELLMRTDMGEHKLSLMDLIGALGIWGKMQAGT